MILPFEVSLNCLNKYELIVCHSEVSGVSNCIIREQTWGADTLSAFSWKKSEQKEDHLLLSNIWSSSFSRVLVAALKRSHSVAHSLGFLLYPPFSLMATGTFSKRTCPVIGVGDSP